MDHKLVLLRHGESEWNRLNLFTGWVDIGLSEQGAREAEEAGELLKKSGFIFDKAFVSYLKRAEDTLAIALKVLGQEPPIERSWVLNERHYGALQGKNKAEIREQYGDEQFTKWRRSYDVPPPPIEAGSEYDQSKEEKYAALKDGQLPMTECLKDVEARVMPYWNEVIRTAMLAGQTVLVSAHGNTMRAILKNLENIPEADISSLEIPTGVPLVLEFDEQGNYLRKEYLGDEEEVKARMEKVRDQGKN